MAKFLTMLDHWTKYLNFNCRPKIQQVAFKVHLVVKIYIYMNFCLCTSMCPLPMSTLCKFEGESSWRNQIPREQI